MWFALLNMLKSSGKFWCVQEKKSQIIFWILFGNYYSKIYVEHQMNQELLFGYSMIFEKYLISILTGNKN